MAIKFIYSFLFLVLLSSVNVHAQIQNENAVPDKKMTRDMILDNSSQGREFWIAIPPNEYREQAARRVLEIYVTSKKDTKITMEYPLTGQVTTRQIKANQITSFSSAAGETDFDWEIRSPEKPVRQGIRITSDEPISVYVFNSRSYTSEGYLAIPTSSWGRDYIHLSYYDFYEDILGHGSHRGGGFTIIASQDSTDCKIILRGKGRDLAKTAGGHKIGDTINVMLDKGETYMVMGDGQTAGQFDLSGSEVISNKYVGFISFHMRTKIPSDIFGDGRNYLVEMMPAVNTWGRQYTTVEYDRENRGDFFRIVASADSTNWKVTYYDKKKKNKLGEYSGVLSHRGDVEDFGNTPDGRQAIRGTSVWNADKPFLVMHYSYSAAWDHSPNFDPFMILVVPLEQFVTSTVFQTPDSQNVKFRDNLFNLIAVGDSTEQGQAQLKSLKIDDSYIYQSYPDFLTNSIPGTNLYWLHIPLKQGAHRIEGETHFAGYIYGFDRYNSYGWPGAIGFYNIVTVKDSIPPEILNTENCGDYDLLITELSNGNPHDDPRQEDKGIKSARLLPGSYNYNLYIDTTANLDGEKPVYTLNCQALVADKSKNALAYLEITDKAGNIRYDTLSFDRALLPPVIFTLADISAVDSLNPGRTTSMEFSVSGSRWEATPVKSFYYAVTYPTGSLRYNSDIVKSSSLDNSWTVMASESVLNDSLTELVISGNGETPISEDIPLATFSFVTFLQPEKLLVPVISSVGIDNSDCIRTDGIAGGIDFNACAFGLRQIRFMGYEYSLGEVAPNPVESGSIGIKYGLGLDGETSLVIYNNLGAPVKSLVRSRQSAGIYELNIPSDALPDGIYFARLVSGQFSSARSFVIAR